jgi:hypothetical protein
MLSASMQTRAIHAGIAVAVLVAEILVATVFAPVRFVRSFLSDYLVVMLLYHAVRAATSLAPRRVAVGVFAFACIVEVSQYFHLVDVLGLRHGSLLAIALGNSFSVPDLLMYALGCLTSWLLDTRLLSRPQLRPETPPAPSA